MQNIIRSPDPLDGSQCPAHSAETEMRAVQRCVGESFEPAHRAGAFGRALNIHDRGALWRRGGRHPTKKATTQLRQTVDVDERNDDLAAEPRSVSRPQREDDNRAASDSPSVASPTR